MSIAFPWVFYVNFFGSPSGELTDFQSATRAYAVLLMCLGPGAFGALAMRDSKKESFVGKALVCLATFCVSYLWFLLLFHHEETDQVTSIVFFLASLAFIWIARICFWIAWARTPTKLELKVQDIAVALLAGGAIVSRWADLADISADWFGPVFVFCGTTGLGLLLSKYTYELAELLADREDR